MASLSLAVARYDVFLAIVERLEDALTLIERTIVRADELGAPVVDRMGPEFYQQVFAPTPRKARAEGETYEQIRHRLRRRWKPAESADGATRAV